MHTQETVAVTAHIFISGKTWMAGFRRPAESILDCVKELVEDVSCEGESVDLIILDDCWFWQR